MDEVNLFRIDSIHFYLLLSGTLHVFTGSLHVFQQALHVLNTRHEIEYRVFTLSAFCSYPYTKRSTGDRPDPQNRSRTSSHRFHQAC
jgi:hypothetical protein